MLAVAASLTRFGHINCYTIKLSAELHTI